MHFGSKYQLGPSFMGQIQKVVHNEVQEANCFFLNANWIFSSRSHCCYGDSDFFSLLNSILCTKQSCYASNCHYAQKLRGRTNRDRQDNNFLSYFQHSFLTTSPATIPSFIKIHSQHAGNEF